MAQVIRFPGVPVDDPPLAADEVAVDDLTLADRLAMILSEIVDEPLLILAHGAGYQQPRELTLKHFKPELAERAVALLEEAGW